MSLIRPRPNRVRIVRHICRLKEPHRDTLLAYARFINDTPDYVMNQLIETTLAKDREFMSWRAEGAGSDRRTPEDTAARDTTKRRSKDAD